MDRPAADIISVLSCTSKEFFSFPKYLFAKFVVCRNPNGTEQWYKFDDGEVSECKMHEDEELKAQCFGGDYMGEVVCEKFTF